MKFAFLYLSVILNERPIDYVSSIRINALHGVHWYKNNVLLINVLLELYNNIIPATVL